MADERHIIYRPESADSKVMNIDSGSRISRCDRSLRVAGAGGSRKCQGACNYDLNWQRYATIAAPVPNLQRPPASLERKTPSKKTIDSFLSSLATSVARSPQTTAVKCTGE